jgi:hypothetical protein
VLYWFQAFAFIKRNVYCYGADVSETSGGGEVRALAMDEVGVVAGGRDGVVRGWRFTDDDVNPEFFEQLDK